MKLGLVEALHVDQVQKGKNTKSKTDCDECVHE